METSPETLTVIGQAAFRLPFMLLALFLVLAIHELGHYIFARLFGMNVTRVEVGVGKEIFRRGRPDKTIWVYRLIPFGAFVHIEGLADDIGGKNTKAFLSHPYWQRALTILGGPLFNLATPFILLSAFYLAVGQPSMPPVIVGVEHGQVGQEQGLKPGDRLLEIDGKTVRNTRQIWRYGYDGKPVEHDYIFERDGETLEKTFTPAWAEYRDDNGLFHEHTRYGVLWDHDGFALKHMLEINDRDVEDKPDLARKIITQNFDRPITIRLVGPQKSKRFVFDVIVSAAANPNLNTKGHKDHKLVYFGEHAHNIYLKQPVGAQLTDAVLFTLDRMKNIAKLPFQLFPLDRAAISDEGGVKNPQTPLTNFTYALIYKIVIGSILIAYINLLPLPYLDGGYLLTQTIERLRKKPLTRKFKARLFAASFFIIYFSILMANKDNLPFYIDSRLQKVNEFINPKNPNTNKEDSYG